MALRDFGGPDSDGEGVYRFGDGRVPESFAAITVHSLTTDGFKVDIDSPHDADQFAIVCRDAGTPVTQAEIATLDRMPALGFRAVGSIAFEGVCPGGGLRKAAARLARAALGLDGDFQGSLVAHYERT